MTCSPSQPRNQDPSPEKAHSRRLDQGPETDEKTPHNGEPDDHWHEWSEWIGGSFGSRYRYCVDSTCDAGEIG